MGSKFSKNVWHHLWTAPKLTWWLPPRFSSSSSFCHFHFRDALYDKHILSQRVRDTLKVKICTYVMILRHHFLMTIFNIFYKIPWPFLMGDFLRATKQLFQSKIKIYCWRIDSLGQSKMQLPFCFCCCCFKWNFCQDLYET